VPDRDIGVALLGNIADGSLFYEFGVFDGTVDGGNVNGDINDGKDWVFRAFSHPFRWTHSAWLRNLGVGFAATYGHERGTPTNTYLPQYKTTGQNVFFTFATSLTNVAVAYGVHYRLTPQLYYYVGPFGLLTEYVYSSTTILSNGVQAPLASQAWQVEASFVLTGENASYQGVDPRRPINLRKRHFGAVEVSGRYGQLRVDPNVFPVFADPSKSAGQALEWVVQATWYFTRLVKFALLFERTTFQGGAPMGGDRVPENGLIGRLGLAF
jgi:phosphate-selective porin OprO/OprP